MNKQQIRYLTYFSVFFLGFIAGTLAWIAQTKVGTASVILPTVGTVSIGLVTVLVVAHYTLKKKEEAVRG